MRSSISSLEPKDVQLVLRRSEGNSTKNHAANTCPNEKEGTTRRLLAAHSGLTVTWSGDAPAIPARTVRRTLALAVKRGIDIFGALAGLLVFSPLLLGVAIAINRADGGPILFRQTRLGLWGKPFTIYKFRSMTLSCGHASPLQSATKANVRFDRLGRFLRKTSIDELPQFLNVLRGEMSLVGPRPHIPEMLAAGIPYEDVSPHYRYRTLMRPGMTGWAQCNGLRGAIATREQAILRIEHDIAYMQNHSAMLDALIIWRTLRHEFLTGNGR